MKTKKSLSTQEIKKICDVIGERTGFPGLKRYLIEQAFTRSSYSKQHGGTNNEVLEFLGDTILNYHIVLRLVEHYGIVKNTEDESFYTFRAHEKDFAELKDKIVSNHTLAKMMDEWDLCQYLIVGQCDIDNKIDEQEKIKADLLEAIIGALFVQTKRDPQKMKEIITNILPDEKLERYISDYEQSQYRIPEFRLENAVNTLKEQAEHELCSPPIYNIKFGYNKSGNPIWCCTCTVESWGILRQVWATSKKVAKKYAAYLILCKEFDLTNQFGPDINCIIWGFFDGKLIPNPQIP